MVALFQKAFESDENLEEEPEQRLFDECNYFSKEQVTELNKLLLETEYNSGFYVSVLISDNVGSDKSDRGVADYVDIYYEKKFGINTDGILFLINSDNYYDYISTSGYAIQIFNNDAIKALFDYFWDDMLNGDFYIAVVKYCKRVEYFAKLNNGYSEEEPSFPSTSEITKRIFENIDFHSAVEKKIDSINDYFNLNTSSIVNMSYFICGSGAYPDELLIIRFIDKKAAEDAKPEVQKRLDSQVDMFKSYTPDEMYKLENAVIKTKDEYLFFYATADNNKVDEIVNSFLE